MTHRDGQPDRNERGSRILDPTMAAARVEDSAKDNESIRTVTISMIVLSAVLAEPTRTHLVKESCLTLALSRKGAQQELITKLRVCLPPRSPLDIGPRQRVTRARVTDESRAHLARIWPGGSGMRAIG